MPKQAGHLRTLFQGLCLAAILAVGFAIMWGMVVGWSVAIWEEARRTDGYQHVRVAVDGTPLIEMDHAETARHTYRTLEGEPVVPEQRVWLPEVLLRAPETVTRQTPIRRRRRMPTFSNEGTPTVLWYLMFDRKGNPTAYFVGFNRRTKRRVGYIGRAGFQQEWPADDQQFPVHVSQLGNNGIVTISDYLDDVSGPRGKYFDMDGNRPVPESTIFVHSRDRVFEIDLQARSVKRLFELPGMHEVDGFVRVAGAPDELETLSPTDVAVFWTARTAERIVVFDRSGRQLRAYTIPQKLRDQYFRFAELPGGKALVSWLDHDDRTGGSYEHLRWLNRRGDILREEKVVHDADPGIRGARDASLVVAAVIPAPASGLLMSLYTVPRLDDMRTGDAASYSTALAKSLQQTWPALVIVLTVGIAAVLGYEARRKKDGRPRSWAWVIFVFLFGLPGLVGYLLHLGQPVRETCPACQAESPRDDENCRFCGTPFPEPSPRGIEVFA